MATYSGNGTGTAGAGSYTLKLDVWESNVDYANNKSPVNWALKLASGNYNFYDHTIYIEVYVDGIVYSASPKFGIDKNSEITIASGSKDIWHNSDGRKSISVSARMRATGAYYLPRKYRCWWNF